MSIPRSMLCIFDIDDTGYRTGCRSGSHLQNCGNFTCPDSMVKCPESYCIPRRFVCDGNVQCPNGEDEQNCTCTNVDREVLIFVEDTTSETESKTAALKLADQLFTSNSIIRLLHFKTLTPSKEFQIEHRLLSIRDERFEPFNKVKRISDCNYNSMARNLLENIRFSKLELKSIIFIEDSEESSKVAELMFTNLSRPDFQIYRVVKDFSYNKSKVNEKNLYVFVKDVHVIKWKALYSLGYKRFPEVCEAEYRIPCSGRYRCLWSRQCIPLDQVCDRIAQCRNKDDEQLCGIVCPPNCTCVGYSVDCRAASIYDSDIITLSTNTRNADISQNPGIINMLSNGTLRFPFMINFNMSHCQIRDVSKNIFFYLYNLDSLDMGYNRINSLPEQLFSSLKHLRFLNLDGNFDLEVISATAFHGLESIKRLRITGTKLKRISSNTFSNLNLEIIDIQSNQIEEIENYAFSNTSVLNINIDGNNILTFNKFIFSGVTSLQELRTPAFKFCCIRPCYVSESDCYPSKDEFSSCGDLMRNHVLQAVLWLVGLAALFGNLGSIVFRLVYDRERLKIGYGIFVTNLAVADFLMAVYLIMIAIVDSLYRDRYIYEDEQWRNSKWCITAGVLSTVSSEASVLFLILITLDRLLVIKYPFGTVRLGPSKAYICCLISWVVAFAMALIPVFYTGYFKNRFYSRSGVCIALPLTRDKPPGWMYSVAIFVGLNFCTFVLVAFGQLSIFLELRKATSGLKKTQMSRKRDLQVARNLILVASTDFLCWFPIGVMGMVALSGHPIPGDVYAWTAVFILPLNSALNPLLYTFTAIIGKNKFNPSTEEQDRIEIEKELGSVILQHKNFCRYIRMKGDFESIGQVKTVKDMLDDVGTIPTIAVLAISMHLSKYICLLHESSIGIDKLSEDTTYIKLNKHKRYKVKFLLDWKISITNDERKKPENIYQFGILLRRIVAKNK